MDFSPGKQNFLNGNRQIFSSEKMEKVLVIGCPGAGKSTFARKLRDRTSLPLYYLDMIWHRADGTNISREAFVRQVSEIAGREQWIIDGNYLNSLEMRLQECDTVFLLDYPLELCLAGAKERIGEKREDLPWIETEFDQEFRRWIVDFPKEQLPRIYRMLEKYSDNRELFVFRKREDAEAYLALLEQRKMSRETKGKRLWIF